MIEFKLEEEFVKTGGHYTSKSILVESNSIGDKIVDISFPININLLCAQFITEEDSFKDEIEVQIAPNTVIGINTAQVLSGSDSITVSQTVIDNIDVGYKVRISDGSNTEELGLCLEIDSSLNIIKVETPTTNLYEIGAGVDITACVVQKSSIGHAGKLHLGFNKTGASYISANTVIRFIYSNKTAVSKSFAVWMEYLY